MIKNSLRRFCAAFFLLLICAAVYAPVLKFDFVNWDDPEYVYENPSIRSFSPAHLSAWLTKPKVQLYVPAVMATYALDYRMGELRATQYHRTNLALHLLNTLLVMGILACFFESRILCLLGALLFALHPVQVESVAWISERKTLLFSFFSLAGFLMLLRRPRPVTGVVVICFLLALMSKITAVMLPVIALAYFYFYEPESFKKKAGALAFWLIPAAVTAALTLMLYAHLPAYFKNENFVSIFKEMILKPRIYFENLMMPVQLNLFYERPDHFAAAGLFFSAIGALSFLSFLKRSCAGFWFLWIVIWLLPVLTFIPVPVADRHLYLPVLGLSGLILSLFEKRGRALIVFLCALNLFFGVRTVQRLKIWKNSETLWKSVLETYPDHHRANLLLADAYGEDQHDDQAIAIYQKLIRNYPEDALAYVNLSNLFLALGRTQEAKKTVQEMEAKTYAAPYDLYALRAGIAHLEGHSDESLEYLEKAVRAASPDSSVYYTLGRLYFSKQNWTGAAAMFEETVRLNPALPEAYYFCALTHNILKHWDRALHYLKLMHEQDMHHSGLLLQEGYAYFNLGQLPQARQAYLQNLDRDPGSADAYFHLGLIALRQNQKDEAIHYFQQAVSLDPESGQYRKVLQQSLSSANPS